LESVGRVKTLCADTRHLRPAAGIAELKAPHKIQAKARFEGVFIRLPRRERTKVRVTIRTPLVLIFSRKKRRDRGRFFNRPAVHRRKVQLEVPEREPGVS
jgi:hypothetical protein